MLLALVLGVSLLAQAAYSVPAIYNTQPQQQVPQIWQYDYDTSRLPNYYKYNYAATDGSSRAEQGGIQNLGTKDAALDVKGAVRWYDSTGQLYEMIYKAGKRGYNTIIRPVRS